MSEQTGDEVGETRAVSVGLLSVVSGGDTSDGSYVSDGDEVISGSVEDVRDPVETTWEIDSGIEVVETAPEANESEGEGVISGCMEDVREWVETPWEAGSEDEVNGTASETKLDGLDGAGVISGCTKDVEEPLEIIAVIDEAGIPLLCSALLD